MQVRARRLSAAQATLGAAAAVALGVGCTGDEASEKLFEAAVLCEHSSAELIFDPRGRVEVRVGDGTVAWADGDRRGLESDACDKAPTPDEAFVGNRRTSVRRPAVVSCRFTGPFLLHVYPVYDSRSGENRERASGSAVSLLVGWRNTLLAFAAMAPDSSESYLSYWPRHCGAE